ncbi:MAG: glycoside hydrolase family 88 protein [Candidatus Planktophila sp.]
MAGEDTTSSALEAPPLHPLAPMKMSNSFLIDTAHRVIDATWKAGLPQWSWGEGVYLLSEVRFHEVIGSQIPQRVLDWYSRREALTSGHINNVAPGAAAARIHAHGLSDCSSINSALEKWITDPTSATRASNGAVEHWPGGVWADTCYMMGTFLINHGVCIKNPRYIEFVGEQLVAHIELLQNSQTNLFAHGSHKGETFWNYWGRGNAWMSLSALEFLDACQVLEIQPDSYEKIKRALKQQLTALIPLLPEYGIWDVLVDRQIESKGVLETSATAGIGSAMVRAARHFPELREELSQIGSKAIAASLTYVDEAGILTRTSAGTVLQLIPFGYSVIRSDRLQPWGQGLALNAICALLEPNRNLVALQA